MRKYLTGQSSEAAEICKAFGLKLDGLASIDFHLAVGEIATVIARYELYDVSVDEITSVMKRFRLEELGDDSGSQVQDKNSPVVQG